MINDISNMILLKIYYEQQKLNPDMSVVSVKRLGLNMKHYVMAIDHLEKLGLIRGAITKDGGNKMGPIWASLALATITPQGVRVLKNIGMI